MENTTQNLLAWAEASRLSQMTDEELYAQEFEQEQQEPTMADHFALHALGIDWDAQDNRPEKQ